MKDGIDYSTNLGGCKDVDPSEAASKKVVRTSLKDVDTFLSP